MTNIRNILRIALTGKESGRKPISNKCGQLRIIESDK